MVAVIIALAVGGYMAYQRYYAPKSEVKIQKNCTSNGLWYPC